MLLGRRRMAVPDALEHLVGLQAQVPDQPYIGLWSRLEGFDPCELGEMVAGRAAVRIALMRGTLHLVTARDCLTLRAVMQPVLDRTFYTSSSFGKAIAGIDPDDIVSAGRALLEEEGPLGNAALGRRLKERWPDRDHTALAYAVHYLSPLVQVPPRGVWGKRGAAKLCPADVFLGRRLEPATAPDEIVRRYLGAFGPASAADVRAWSGLTGVRDVLERLRAGLRVFRDEHGRDLFDVPDGPLPDPATAAPPRFLPEYDNALLGHGDRTRVIPAEHRWTATGAGLGSSLLIDGFVGGTWKLERGRGAATLSVAPHRRLSRRDATDVSDEGARLLAFAAPDDSHDLRLLPPA